MYAGYFLVKMIMTDDSWFAVRNTPGVTGFVSAEDETESYSGTDPHVWLDPQNAKIISQKIVKVLTFQLLFA